MFFEPFDGAFDRRFLNQVLPTAVHRTDLRRRICQRKETVHQHIEVLAQHEVCIETIEFVGRGTGAPVKDEGSRRSARRSQINKRRSAWSPGALCQQRQQDLGNLGHVVPCH